MSIPSSTPHSPARPSPRGPCRPSTRREYYESHSLTARLHLVSPSNPQQSLAAETGLHNPAERRGWVRHLGPRRPRSSRPSGPWVVSVGSAALTRRNKLDTAPDPPGWWCRPPHCLIVPAESAGSQLSRRTGEDQGAAISTGQTAVRRAISVPLTPVKTCLSRSLADTPPRRSGHVTGPDGTDSQADSAGSIPVTRSTGKPQGQAALGALGGRSHQLRGYSAAPGCQPPRRSLQRP